MNHTKMARVLAIVSCLLLLTLMFASCTSLDDVLSALESDNIQTTDTLSEETESAGNENETTSSGTESDTTAAKAEEETVIQNITQNITNNDITIEGVTNEISYAAALGLRSTVSVYCTFEATVGGISPWNPTPSTQTYYTTGSGVIYQLESDGSGFVITNYHVVYDSSSSTDNHISDKIYIYLYGHEDEAYAIPASYVGGSAAYDLAVLRVEANETLQKAYASGGAAAVGVGDSDMVAPGQTAIAIGNPSASSLSGISVSSGIVSVDSEYITMSAISGSGTTSFRVIRTDAPINSGNSGGGLYNARGELIGIVNAKFNSSSIDNVGYALPSDVVRAIADNIIDYCYLQDCESVMRCMLGITLQVNGYSTFYDTETGMLVRCEEISVNAVESDGLGKDMLQVGDIITSMTVGDRTIEVTRQHHLIDAMLDVRVHDEVSFVVIRDGVKTTVSTTITEDCLAAY